MTQATVLVLGWSGTLGQRIVRLLGEHLPDIKVIGAGRRANPGAAIEARRLDLNDATTFAEALTGINVLIHAAGPFNHDPAPLVSACIERRIHYIDIAETMSFIDDVRHATGSPGECPVAIVSGCSTVPGIAACLSQGFASNENVAHLDVMLNMGSNNPLTQGLCFGLLRPLGRTSPDETTPWFRRLTRETHLDGRVRHYGNYPIPFEQTITVATRNIPVSFKVGFDLAAINYTLYLASFVLPYVSDKMLHAICRLAVRCGGIVSLIGKTEGRFTLVARDKNGVALNSVEVVAAKNGLDIPAITTVWATEQLINPTATHAGFIGLEQLLDSTTLERKLAALPDVSVRHPRTDVDVAPHTKLHST